METKSDKGMEPESQYMAVIRVWAALAWADDVIVPAEAAAMRRLIQRAPMLTEKERADALGFLEHKVELDTEALHRLNPSLRTGVYRAAVQLAHIDRDFAEAERQFLARLRGALYIDEIAAHEIEQDAAKGTKG